MPPQGMSVLGHRVERLEDPPLLTGAAEYLADLHPPGVLHAVFVRSSVAHGVLRAVDVSGARSQPGVVAVFTAGDLALGGIPEWPRAEGPARPALARPCLAGGRVRFVGEAVAVVVAESVAAALDAAELVVVDVDPLPVVVDPLAAMEPDAPLLFPPLGTNIVLDVPPTDAGVLEGADVVVRARFVNQRVAPVPIETNAALVTPEADGRLDCVVTCQAPFAVRNGIAAAMGLALEKVRVRTVAVGGGFGAKGGVYPEQVVVAAAASRLGRPVRHVETRSENLVAMSHGRGQVQDVALGARRDGTIVGLEARTVTDVGAYPWRGGIPFRTARLMANGAYRIPRLALASLGVVTNTTPVGPYRGAGRPEATAMLERAMDMLSAELGMDPAEVRRRNLLAPGDFPYRTPTGAVYDSGDYGRALDEALELAGYGALRAEQAERRRRGDPVALGVGLSTFVEISGSGGEFGAVTVEGDGTVVVTTGASPHGQGLATVLTQLAGSVLGVDQVKIVHSDTDLVPTGVGTFGSRSGQLAGNAVVGAAQEVLDQAREVASGLLEVSPADVVVVDGGLAVVGVPQSALSWAQVAAAAPGGRLHAEGEFTQEEGTYPFGAHVGVVEVDTETGRVSLRRFVAVDDCGTVVNPTIVEGQVHGGLAQGIAQALFEEVRYDEWGNPLTATLADYAVPSAAELPSFELGETETPSPQNPLGMKGVGESGTVGATVAVQNALVDALSPLGVRHVDMPLTPERVWRAIGSPRSSSSSS
ncbi:MAG: xanthine dehydrogenase family protein molybdopterin-binding subunit [Actinomycetota bacterium]|nr:xanthine dehydrogenase family protein molybdopterin-binding subunit [Actinomycetota bacterium]